MPSEILIVILIAVGLSLISIILSYLALMKKYYSLQVNYKRIRSKIKRKAEKLEEHARDKSHHILDDAQDRAEEIFKTAQSVGEHERELIDAEISRGQRELTADFKRAASAEIEVFRKAMQSSTLEVQTEARVKLEEAEKRVARELAAYKLEREKQLEQDIFVILKDTVRQVTGKVIDPSDHKDLVLKALGEVKGKHV